MVSLRLVKPLLLLLMGVFLFTRVTSGAIYYYINQRFIMLTVLAAAGFVLFAYSYLRQYLDDASAADPHHHHDHHHHAPQTWLGLLIVTLPFLLGWLVPAQPLGAVAIANREINLGAASGLPSLNAPNADEMMGFFTGEPNILDWLNQFQRSNNPAAFDGQEARVIGFVYRDARFGDDQFLVARFTVSCCVADASPVGLLVRWPDALELPADQWVEVHGRFEAAEFNGMAVPVLVAEQVIRTEQPAQPYLYL